MHSVENFTKLINHILLIVGIIFKVIVVKVNKLR